MRPQSLTPDEIVSAKTTLFDGLRMMRLKRDVHAYYRSCDFASACFIETRHYRRTARTTKLKIRTLLVADV
jgi:hypothetical protein